MNGLLPCPFCGSDDVTETNDVGLTESSIVSYTVVCGDCGAGFSFGMKYERWEAIRAWNTRSAYETDDYFYLPKPKEKLVSVSSPIITEIENGVRASVGISVIDKAVRKWQEEIERNSDKEIIKRICEVFNPERTCECDGTICWEWTGPTTYYEHELSCGHVITSTDKEPPNYCEECGAKVIKVVDNAD